MYIYIKYNYVYIYHSVRLGSDHPKQTTHFSALIIPMRCTCLKSNPQSHILFLKVVFAKKYGEPLPGGTWGTL